ncbi:MAG: AAA family ATPase [Acidimicrobiia bacterium]
MRTRATDVVQAAEEGRSQALVVHGELGMGKTTLLDEVRVAAAHRAVAVLETRGVEADAELGFASLLTLLRPLDDELDELAGPNAVDVRAALTLGTREPTDDRRVRLGVYRVITNLAERGLVLVLVDDAHHLDAATSSVLAFVISRLARDPVAMLLTVDGELLPPLGDLALPTVTLGPLPREELEALVRSEGPIAPDALARCCALADGNPLIAIEVARSLDADERAGRVPVSLLPRPPAALARRLAMRFDELADDAGRALVVVAADDTGRLGVVRAALAQLAEPTEALERAERSGLIEVDGPTVRFAHPLLRAVAYHRVAPPSRRAAHRALAGVLSGPEDAAARAWQLAAAAEGEDETAAEALVLVAGDLARRGGAASAARVLERAAGLTTPGNVRSARMLAAAEAWVTAFEPDAARRALAEVAPSADPEILVGAAQVARWTDGPVAALERVRVATDGAVRDLALAMEADLLLDTVGAAAAAELAGPLVERAATAGGARVLAEIVLARVGGDLPVHAPAEESAVGGRVAALVALRRVQAAGESGAVIALPALRGVEVVVAAATARRHAGDVVGAYDRLVLELGLVPERASLQRAFVEVALADIEQLLGRDDDARAHLASALPLLGERQARALGAGGPWVEGRLALGTGDVASACAPLETAARCRPHLYAPELAVALAAAGRPNEAERWVGAIADQYDAGSLTAARCARARAALRGDDTLFLRAAAETDDAGLPIEACETRLAHAEHLTRTRRADEGRELALLAGDELARLGIRGWAVRVGRVLDPATGTPGDVAGELTSAEYRVALAVAEGATNREAAATLFLSVKTVDFHLQNIYRKLGLRSRTELAVRLTRHTDPTLRSRTST